MSARDASGGGYFGEPSGGKFFVSQECEGCLGGWMLRRAPECQVFLQVASARDASGGGCFGEPPSVMFFVSRECEGRLGGWLLRRAPECHVFLSRELREI